MAKIAVVTKRKIDKTLKGLRSRFFFRAIGRLVTKAHSAPYWEVAKGNELASLRAYLGYPEARQVLQRRVKVVEAWVRKLESRIEILSSIADQNEIHKTQAADSACRQMAELLESAIRPPKARVSVPARPAARP